MDSLTFRVTVLDAATKEMNKIHENVNKSLSSMTKAQQDYTKSIQTTEKTVMSLRKESISASAARQKEIQKEISLTKQLEQQYKRALSQENKKVSSNNTPGISGVGGIIGGLGIAGPAGAAVAVALQGVSAFSDMVKSVVKTRSEIESLQSRLSVLQGSRIKGREMFGEIAETASKTKFEIQDLTEFVVAVSGRIGKGFKYSNDQMIGVADAAAAIGKPMEFLQGAIVDATDTARWKNLGVTMKTQGDKMTLTYGTFSKTVERSTQGALEFIAALGKTEGIAGMSAKAVETIEGKLSNLNDNFTMLKNNIGERFEPTIKSSIGVVSDLIGWFKDWAEIPLSQVLTDDKTKMELVYQQILKTNDGSKERKKLLAELKDLYPDYFKYLDAEKSKLDDITKAHDKAAKAANDRIKQAVWTEVNKDNIKEQANAEIELQKKITRRDLYNQYQYARTDEDRQSIQRAYEATGGQMILTSGNKKRVESQRLQYSKEVIEAQHRLDAANKEVERVNKLAEPINKAITQNTSDKFADQYKAILAKTPSSRTFGETAFIKEYQNKSHTNESLEKALTSNPKTVDGKEKLKADRDALIEIDRKHREERENKLLQRKQEQASYQELSVGRNVRQVNLKVDRINGVGETVNINESNKLLNPQTLGDLIAQAVNKVLLDASTLQYNNQ